MLPAVDDELAMSAKFEMVDFTCEPNELTAMVIPIAIPAAIKPYSMAVLPESFLARTRKSRRRPWAGQLSGAHLPGIACSAA
jgi:hypothetical protein